MGKHEEQHEEYTVLTGSNATMPQHTDTKPFRRPVARLWGAGIVTIGLLGALWGFSGHGAQVAGDDADGDRAYAASKPCDPTTANRLVIVDNQTRIAGPTEDPEGERACDRSFSAAKYIARERAVRNDPPPPVAAVPGPPGGDGLNRPPAK